MEPLRMNAFGSWLEKYGEASREGDPQASANLFSQDAEYYESPFDDPIVGRDAIYQYWSAGAENFRDQESTYEILSVKDDLGIARWQSRFTNNNTGKRLALDCIFLAEFDIDGKCSVFREWWHLQTLNSNAQERFR